MCLSLSHYLFLTFTSIGSGSKSVCQWFPVLKTLHRFPYPRSTSPQRFLKTYSASASTNKMANSASGSVDRDKCIFCKIVDGKESNEIFYQDGEIVVFQDIRPASKHHLLVVPREHIRDAKTLLPKDLGLLDRLVQTGNQVLLEHIQKEAPETTNLDNITKVSGFHWPPFHTVSHLHLHVISPTNQMGFLSKNIFRPNSYWFVTPEYVKERLEKMAADSK